MKNIFFLFILSLFLLSSCDEEKRIIVPFVPEGNRVILLEEFTGKGCTNCPKGSREIENLILQFPNNLVAVSIHAGFFANPEFFPVGQYDFRTEEGQALYDYLGTPVGYPSGVVDRIAVGGTLQISLNQWASSINRDLQEDPKVELSIVKAYNPATRELTVTINGIGKESVTADLRLSVMLTESSIVDAQDDQEAGGIVDNYVHNHVLRDMLTAASGDSFASSITAGQTFTRTYTTTINGQWVADNMHIVAFVSAVNGANFPVLQATQAGVTE